MRGERVSDKEVLLSLNPTELIGLVNSAWHAVVFCSQDDGLFVTVSDIAVTQALMRVATSLLDRDTLIESWCAIHAEHPEPQDAVRNLVTERVDLWLKAIAAIEAAEHKARGEG